MSESVSEELHHHQSRQQVQQQSSLSEPRYSLRGTFKIPSRYRDINRDEFNEQNTSFGFTRDRRSNRNLNTNQRQLASLKQEDASMSPNIQNVSISFSNEMEEHNERDFNYVSQEPIEHPNFCFAPPERFGGANQGTELSDDLKGNLRKLKNVLKLPKARRFVFCEFFYSGVDQQLFLAENEFSQLMKESFPNLKCSKLRKPEWREIRRLIGKPRRCSQVFLNEERESLEAKRQKIRTIYNGTCTTLGQEAFDLPPFLPRPPVVGMKIYARVRSPKDGIYAGTVDAVIGDGYRVVFDKEEMIPPCIIKDYEVMFDQPSELLAINYFLEMNRANIRGTAKISPMSHLYPSSNYIATESAKKQTGMMVMGLPDGQGYSYTQKKLSLGKDEKVGNFPVRMLVILVKLCKVIEYKKQLISNLTWMNDNAEKMNLLTNEYPHEFKIQYSQLVLHIEHINKLFKTYLTAIQGYHETLLPHLNEPQQTDRPLALRKTSDTHSFQLVKHCNNELRTIGAQKKRYSACDLSLLNESLKQIRSQILPQNAAAFQDCVEVHMKQVYKMMLKGGTF